MDQGSSKYLEAETSLAYFEKTKVSRAELDYRREMRSERQRQDHAGFIRTSNCIPSEIGNHWRVIRNYLNFIRWLPWEG